MTSTASHTEHDTTRAASGSAPSRGPSALSIEGVVKSFGSTPVLRGVSLDLQPGSICALLGESGSGKTTLLRAIAGLERIDAGVVTVAGTVVSSPTVWVAPEKRRVGMVFQDWALFPQMTVAENVAFGLSKDQRRTGRVDEVLRLVGLADLADRLPGTLSGGQQQRVALARALAPRPALLLLDEPFSNLDSTLRTRVRTEVHELLASAGVTAVFVTHDQDEAFVLGDVVAVVHDGRFAQVAPPRELYQHPVSPWVATFVGEANLMSGVVVDGSAALPIGPASIANGPAAGRVRVLVRPEHVAVRATDDHDGGNASVELVEYYGHDAIVLLRLDHDRSTVRARVAHTDLVRGDRAEVRYHGPSTVAYPDDGSAPG